MVMGHAVIERQHARSHCYDRKGKANEGQSGYYRLTDFLPHRRLHNTISNRGAIYSGLPIA